jgi:hypothetical protein
MKKSALGFVMVLGLSCGAAWAESAKPADEPSGCVERAQMEKYIAAHNFAELLRGEGADGKTQGVWTNGTRLLIVNYVRPADGRMDELKTICVTNSVANVNFNFAVIERLVQSAAESLKAK